MFRLRPYQEECLSAIRDAHQEHGSVLVEVATGLGKTVIFSKYASSWEHGRTLVVCPMLTIISQTAKKILKETGIYPAIEQASLWSNETEWARSPYIVASKDSLCSGNGTKRYQRFQDVGLVIVDEAHYACTELYYDMISWFRDKGAKILGVTATAKRHDKRALGQVFDHCPYQYGILSAISDGWLVPIQVTCLQLQKLDLTNVQTTTTFQGKDFNQKQLNEVLENPEVIYEICAAVHQETQGRKTVIYCASVNEAKAVAELLRDQYGYCSGWVCADEKRCTKQQRREVLDSFATPGPGQISHVANVGILTTGWDFPGLECIVNARPTKSLPLYTQILGRLTRPIEEDGLPVCDHEGLATADDRRLAIEKSRKPFGRMIDLVDNSLRHKICTALDVLGGEWSLADREAVFQRLLGKSGGRDADDVLRDEKEEQERKRQDEEARRLAREEALRRQRAATAVREARFARLEVDPFSADRIAVRSRQQHDMATDKQRRCLWAMGWKTVDQYDLTKSQAGRAISQIKKGMLPETLARLYRKRVTDAVKPKQPQVFNQKLPF